jgi:hypothetical protein
MRRLTNNETISARKLTFYHGNYLLRAAAALAGIYGNNAEEAMYPLAKNSDDGSPLDGSKHNYTLTFPAGQYPPVNAFWSVTMYDGKTQLLIENPINRYLINSPTLPPPPIRSQTGCPHPMARFIW